MEVKKAVIPAAGYGTRLLPATKSQPKEMLPIVDKPTLHYVVQEAVEAGIDDILIITSGGKGKRAIEDYFDKYHELEEALEEDGKDELLEQVREVNNYPDIHYVRQKEQRGLGDAILYAERHVGDDPFVLLLGDRIINSDVNYTEKMIQKYRKYKTSMIGVQPVKEELIPSHGIVDVEEIGDECVKRVKDLIEKPPVGEAPSNLGIIGRYILTPEIFETLKDTKVGKGGEIQLTDAIRKLNERQAIYSFEINENVYDVGNKLDYTKTFIDLAVEKFGDEIKEHLKKHVD